MKRERVGLIAARHSMPVDSYWLDEVENPQDFEWLRAQAFLFCKKKKAEDVHVDMFVTGLSSALAAFIEAAFATRLSFSLWHWKPKVHFYQEQKIIAPWVYDSFKDMEFEDLEVINQAICRGYLSPYDMKPYVNEEWLAAFAKTQKLGEFFDVDDVPFGHHEKRWERRWKND